MQNIDDSKGTYADSYSDTSSGSMALSRGMQMSSTERVVWFMYYVPHISFIKNKFRYAMAVGEAQMSR